MSIYGISKNCCHYAWWLIDLSSYDSDEIIYARIDKDIVKSHSVTHYDIPRDQIEFEDMELFAKGEKVPDEKYAVKGVDALIITKPKGNSGFLLIFCDKSWNALTDSWYETINEAKNQAEIEFLGISSKWIQKK